MRVPLGRLAADALLAPPIAEDLVQVQTIQLRVRNYKPLLQSSCRPCKNSTDTLSKVRSVRDRHGIFLELERLLIAEIVLRAGPFLDWAIGLLQTCHPRPRRFEGAGILHRDDCFEPVSGICELPAFHHVQVLGMRRRYVVHEAQGMLDEGDGIDDKLAVLVMADGLPEP